MTRSLWAVICCALVCTSHAMAQSNPVFTEKMVHPVSPPVLDAPSKANPPLEPAARPVSRGSTPRSHAQEVAEVFKQACLQSRAQMSVASDWALARGFSPLPEDEVKAMGENRNGGKGPQLVSIYARERDDKDTLMLMLVDHPRACSVGTRQQIDGQRLRERMAQFAADWVGQAKAPAPVMSMDTEGATVRTIIYKAASGHESLMVIAPTAVGRGVTMMVLSIDESPSPLR